VFQNVIKENQCLLSSITQYVLFVERLAQNAPLKMTTTSNAQPVILGSFTTPFINTAMMDADKGLLGTTTSVLMNDQMDMDQQRIKCALNVHLKDVPAVIGTLRDILASNVKKD